mmetsp:Transcript_23044/g.42296  ORF Transcript_23044/g.42296 Transcript_23044/m.42296 type:complete len:401 (-) Transcript_23044:247-1449(-)
MGSGSLSYYEALGIERNALSNEIRDAYKKQSLALHPDKNVYGASMMKLVNEAYRVLYDEAERARYDREDRGNRGSNSNGQNSAVVRSLKLQLAESEHKRCMLKQGQDKLKKKVIYLQDKVDVAREEADVAREELSLSKALQSVQNGKNKHLQAKLHYSGQEQKRIENEADYLKSENDLLERESQDHKRRIDLYENKVERSSRALREERLKSSDDLARAEEKAKEKLEHAKTLLSERSVCYRCNGEATSTEDCTLCEGNGAIQGIWTKCHNCDGTGSFTSIRGTEESCAVCSSKGAREGILSMTCFKCKGRRSVKDCSICYRGKIKGFNLKLCPFCRGEGTCENCCERAYVSCQCGSSCVGHKPNEISKPTTPSSLQRRIALGNERDWKANFLTRNWLSPL